jgi:hypothetical protein
MRSVRSTSTISLDLIIAITFFKNYEFCKNSGKFVKYVRGKKMKDNDVNRII